MSLLDKIRHAVGLPESKPPADAEENPEKCSRCGYEKPINVTSLGDTTEKRVCGECGNRWQF